jgi:hypothetical protein
MTMKASRKRNAMGGAIPPLVKLAHNEAGHAVIGRVLGLPCGHVTIVTDQDSSGHSITPSIWQSKRRGKLAIDGVAGR